MKNKYGGTSTTFQREYLRSDFIDFNDKELLPYYTKIRTQVINGPIINAIKN